MGQDAANSLGRQAEIGQRLADQVTHVEHHAAAGPARSRRDDEDPRRRRMEGQARLPSRSRQPFRVHGGLDCPFQVLADALAMVHQRQASQGAQTLRLQRAGDVVNPSAAQPLHPLARAADGSRPAAATAEERPNALSSDH